MKLCTLFTLFSTFRATIGKDPSEEGEFPEGSKFANVVKCKYYVDKTLLVKAFMENSFNKSFVTAPDNFGKSLNIQMLKHFLEIQTDMEGREIIDKTQTKNFKLFVNTKIYKEDPEFFEEHFGKYPVVFADYKRLSKMDSYKSMIKKMRRVLLETFQEHLYLLNVDGLIVPSMGEFAFERYITRRKKLSPLAIARGLSYLAGLLEKHFKRKPILLIDNYDSFALGLVFGYIQDFYSVYNLMTAMHKEFVKPGKEMSQRYFSTGVLRTVAGSGNSPSDSIVKGFSFLHKHHGYFPYYGLMEEELEELLNKYTNDQLERKELKNNIRTYYGGYTALDKKTKIYNTKSVLLYLKRKRQGKTDALRSYWVKPWFYYSFLNLFYPTFLKIELLGLINNRTVRISYHKMVTEIDIDLLKDNVNDPPTHVVEEGVIVMEMLYYYGYVCFANVKYEEYDFLLEVPNMEIRTEFENMALDVETKQFKMNYDKIIGINEIFNGISESNCAKAEFEFLVSEFNSLFIHSIYTSTTDYDMKTTLSIMLQGTFHNNFTSRFLTEQKFSSPLYFINKNGITFILQTKNIMKVYRLGREATMRISNKLVKKTRERNHDRFGITEKRVFMGFTFTFKEDTMYRMIAISYSKNFGKNNVNRTTSFVQELLPDV